MEEGRCKTKLLQNDFPWSTKVSEITLSLM